MASAESSFEVRTGPTDALQLCALALTGAGFKNVNANEPARLITAQKKARGQWTKSQLTVALAETEAGTMVRLISEAQAQSLSSLASDPAQRLVASAERAIQSEFASDE